MPDSIEHSPTRGKITLRVVYWVLGILSFLQLLAVGIALTLKQGENTPSQGMENQHIAKGTQTTNNPTPSQGKGISPQQSEEDFINSIRPRTVEEMLGEEPPTSNATSSLSGNTVGNSGSTSEPFEPQPPQEEHPQSTPSLDGGNLSLSPQLAALLKQSRYHQIEGDMKRSILKLEEAFRLEPDNPVVAYYFGLAYEAIRNADKSREYFLKVVTMREKSGKYFTLAAKHLETGFATPSDRRGDIAFGTILEYREPASGDGERVVLSIPILMKDNLNIRFEDLHIVVHFFELSNNKKIVSSRAEEPQKRWTTTPLDWKEGEETFEIRYYMPTLTPEELTAYGDLKYYGYTAALYYKGEPMDCHASPNVLFLIDRNRQDQDTQDYLNYGDSVNPGVLPTLDTEPASNFNIMEDSTLLPP